MSDVKKIFLNVCCVLVFFVATPITLRAQTAGSPPLESIDALRQLQQQRWLEQAEREQQRSQPGVVVEAAAETQDEPDSPAGLNCVSVRAIEWLGSQRDRIELAPHLRDIPWLAQLPACLSAPEIERRIADLNQRLRQTGLITSRVIPARPVWDDGLLRLQLIAGRIEAYQRPSELPQAMLNTLFPQTDSVLNLRQLEQSLDIVNRLRSFRLRLELQPGQQPGGSVVALKLQRGDALGISHRFDNSGSAQLGQLRWQLAADWDAPLGHGLFFSASVSGDLESRGEDAAFQSRQWHLDYARGNWHLDWDALHSQSSQRLSGLPVRVLSETDQSLYQARLTRLLYRDHRRIWRSAVKLEHSNTKYELAGRELAHSGAASALAAELSLLSYVKRGYWQARIERQWGQSWWGADSDPQAGGPDPGYRRWRLQLSALQQLPEGWLWRGQLLWQSTEDRLPSAQQLSLGGPSILRSDDSGILSGDKGVWMSHLLQGPALADSPLRPQLVWDWGRLRDQRAGWRSASSAGVGFTARSRRDHWQLAYHHRLHGPDNDVNDGDQWRFQWQRHWRELP